MRPPAWARSRDGKWHRPEAMSRLGAHGPLYALWACERGGPTVTHHRLAEVRPLTGVKAAEQCRRCKAASRG